MRKKAVEWIESIGIAALILTVLYFVLWPFEVEGKSMEKTFFTNDRIVISRIAPAVTGIKHGDVIVCDMQEGSRQLKVIKRIVGLPGDHVEINDGIVYINGEALDEPYTENTPTKGQSDITLNENEYFVLGDNRDDSYDSRDIGSINKKALIGKVIAKWFPFNEFKIISNSN